ncbi:MAG: aspartate/glutamate racemase family protein [Gammaproteobacteria bacterium]
MKKIGIVGGIAWRSTADYYAELCRRAEALTCDPHVPPAMPEIVIESLDISKAIGWLGTDGDEDSWRQFDAYHRAALQRLEAAGADFALLASNTPHHRFAQITRGVGIAVINLYAVAADACARLAARRVLILGTELTMRSRVLRQVFQSRGVEVIAPESAQTRRGLADLIAELQRGSSPDALERLGEIVRASCTPAANGQPVLTCLACTELPLAFDAHATRPILQYGGITYVNTLAAHIDAAWKCVIDGEACGHLDLAAGPLPRSAP